MSAALKELDSAQILADVSRSWDEDIVQRLHDLLGENSAPDGRASGIEGGIETNPPRVSEALSRRDVLGLWRRGLVCDFRKSYPR